LELITIGEGERMLGLEMTMEEKGEKRVRLEVLATGGGG
jgi:hypothetical protein